MKTGLLSKLASFLGVGALSTLLQYFILVICVEFVGLSAVAGSAIGFAISAVFNYLLNYHFTFRSDNAHAVAASRFALVASVGLAINTGLMALLVHYTRLPYIVSQVFSTAIVLVWNFFGNALWSFASAREHAAEVLSKGHK